MFVVCSKIGDDEDDADLDRSATAMHNMLSKRFDFKIGKLTGLQSMEERNQVLDAFANGTTKLLVATTIVEVGIDIPSSDIMIIASPERFGLATLHQLRGRVGRDGRESFCFCLAKNLTEKGYERLQYFKTTNDGFALADFDYQLRGAGEMFGTKQHGKGDGVVNNISLKSFKMAEKVLEQIKCNPADYSELIDLSKQKFDDIFTKVIMN